MLEQEASVGDLGATGALAQKARQRTVLAEIHVVRPVERAELAGEPRCTRTLWFGHRWEAGKAGGRSCQGSREVGG